MEEPKKLKKIKSSVLNRSLQLARLSLDTGIRLTNYGASSLFSSDATKGEKWKAFLLERSGAISKDLGELKGSLMKAGQMLSMYGEYFLPPEANELLKSLQSQSPPLEWAVIEKTIQSRMSKEQLSQLVIEKDALGSASLGQVHRAKVIATGEQIVLKIQYPGVEKAIDSDLKALRSFLNLMRILPKNLDLDPLFEEVRSMLTQEMDYAAEIEQTELYGARLKSDPRFVVPKVYREFCADRIIATSYEKGFSPDDSLVMALSQNRKNQLALNFLDLYFCELFDWGVVQTDPHLGNYRVRISADGQDQLVLLDFGAVRSYPAAFLNPYCRMIKAAMMDDLVALRKASAELKFTRKGDSPELLQFFEEFCLLTVEPFRSDTEDYDWKNSKLPQKLTKIGFQMLQKFELRSPPKEMLFLDRKTGGVFIFCAVMNAKIKAKSLLMKYLKKIE